MIANIIFFSRWLQAPLYFGLIVAQGVYVYHFRLELWHLIMKAATISENELMLAVLALIDVVMIANLLIMVIVGGYETFVSHLNLQDLPVCVAAQCSQSSCTFEYIPVPARRAPRIRASSLRFSTAH